MKVLNKMLLNWIYMLCFLGGYINAICIVKYSYTVSHFTGNISKAAINISQGNFSEVFKVLTILIAFVIGTTISGSLVDGREFNLKRRYGYASIILGTGLLVLYSFLYDTLPFFYYLPFMVGVENGLFISYKGVVVRTSHITGSLTDMGGYIGHCIKGKTEDKWKVYFCLFTILAFMAGGFFGIKAFYIFKKEAFLIAAFLYIGVGLTYFTIRQRYQKVIGYPDLKLY